MDSTPNGEAPLLELRNVTRIFHLRGNAMARLTAVRGVSLRVRRGECVGLVGESGCGKSTLGRLVSGLIQPTEGEILFDGAPLPPASAASAAAGRIQMVFQDPFSSLNPRLRVGESVAEGLRAQGFRRRRPGEENLVPERVAGIFRRVGLAGMERRYPHEFSGGQRQRVALARAFVTRPDLVVCDEPVSALDVSVQAQVLNLMKDLQAQDGQAQIFISHNLAVVGFMCSRVAVMYLGEIVEELPSGALARAAHPYTRALYRAMPSGERGLAPVLQGELPSPLAPPPGCRFHPRCPAARDICREEEPVWTEMGPGWRVRCHLAGGPDA